MTISSSGWQFTQFSQLSFFCQEFSLSSFSFADNLVSRVDMHLIVDSIQDQEITALYTFSNVVSTYNRWQFQRTRHDRGMRGTAADISYETTHVVQVDLSCF